ncbi:MAG TPA: hypothetical protein PLY17_18080, partial [Candidatus Hydrogenedentes bacterium]|nr:hypothetical protein [Candidatus Hydrogenedentota bacterium]
MHRVRGVPVRDEPFVEREGKWAVLRSAGDNAADVCGRCAERLRDLPDGHPVPARGSNRPLPADAQAFAPVVNGSFIISYGHNTLNISQIEQQCP